MDAWVTVWKVVLYVGLGLFTAMSLWVIVRGLTDIKSMFATLREEAANAEGDAADSNSLDP